MTTVKVSKKAADFSDKDPDCMMKVEMEANKPGTYPHIFHIFLRYLGSKNKGYRSFFKLNNSIHCWVSSSLS